MPDQLNSALLRDTLGSLQAWRSDMVRLLLYRGVLDTPLGQIWQRLLNQVLDPHPRPQECLLAYGDWFYGLAASGRSWEWHIREAIGSDENPFSQHAQHQSLSQVPVSWQRAVQQDLHILQRLAQADLSLLTRAVEQIAHLSQPLLAIESPDSLTVETSCFGQDRSQSIAAVLVQNWSDRLPELAAHYHQWGVGIWGQYACFRWSGGEFQGIAQPDAVQLDQLAGYEEPKAVLIQNTEVLLRGYPAQNILLYGSRGSGKSSLVKALGNAYAHQGLRLLEVPQSELHHLPDMAAQVRSLPQKFIVFVDDLSFEEDNETFKALKVVLEGSITPQPRNLVVYATTNRRHLVREFTDDRPRPQDGSEIHTWDTFQEKLSFSDRFGITLTFEPADQETYLAIVRHLAAQAQLTLEPAELEFRAKQWATRHNGRSGRTARQFINACMTP